MNCLMCDQPMVRRGLNGWEECDCPSRGYKPLRFDDLNELLRKIKMQAEQSSKPLRKEVLPPREPPHVALERAERQRKQSLNQSAASFGCQLAAIVVGILVVGYMALTMLAAWLAK